MDREPAMLDEAETIEVEELTPESRPKERLRRLASSLPGVRVLAAAPGGGAALALEIDTGDRLEDEPDAVWFAVADGAGQLGALRAGAAGVISSDATAAQLSAAIAAVRAGHGVVTQAMLRELVPAGAVGSGPTLTPREVSVLQLLSEGATNKMIARRLDISVHTAKFHVASILDKLDATTRTDAVAQGVRQGVLML